MPVIYHHRPETPEEGTPLARTPFLADACHTETWRGLTIGVHRNADPWYRHRNDNLNFHGRTLHTPLPQIASVNGPHWSVAVDIRNCPALELRLPERQETVLTPFLLEMRDAARLAIYRAMASHPSPRPSFKDWTLARNAGITLAPHPAQLIPWRPDKADPDLYTPEPKPVPAASDALLVAADLEPHDAHTLWRAAQRNALCSRLFQSNQQLIGYPWYDRIRTITHFNATIDLNGNTLDLERYDPTPTIPSTPLPRPERLAVTLTVAENDRPDTSLELPTDLLLLGDTASWAADTHPLVTLDSHLSPDDLTQLLVDAFFLPSDDSAADSWQRQSELFEQDAQHLATKLLVSTEAAQRATIADVATRELLWLAPPERTTRITIRNGKVSVALTDTPPRPSLSLPAPKLTPGCTP